MGATIIKGSNLPVFSPDQDQFMAGNLNQAIIERFRNFGSMANKAPGPGKNGLPFTFEHGRVGINAVVQVMCRR